MICTHCNRFKVHSFYTQNYCSKQCYLAATRNPENDFRSHWTLAAKDNIVRRGNNLEDLVKLANRQDIAGSAL